MNIDIPTLENTLHQEIPLTSAIGLRVKTLDNNSVSLFAPLKNNVNHKDTAFGGSLYSVAVLTGWSLLHVKLQALDLSAHIVIHEGNMKYMLPVSSDIEAFCSIDSKDNFERFVRMYNRKGIARIALQVFIKQQGEVAVEFTGDYVIHN